MSELGQSVNRQMVWGQPDVTETAVSAESQSQFSEVVSFVPKGLGVVATAEGYNVVPEYRGAAAVLTQLAVNLAAEK